MIRIQKEQWSQLEVHQSRAFEDRLIRFLRNEFGEAVEESDEELREFVRTQGDKAGLYGLTSERQVVVYVTTAYLLTSEFDTEFEEANDILTNLSLPPEAKSRSLKAWSSRTIEEIVNATDEGPGP